MMKNRRKDDESLLSYEVQPSGRELSEPSVGVAYEDKVLSDTDRQILKMLEETEYDFVTIETLSRELGVDEATMQVTLDALEPLVRKAISYSAAHDKWYRLTSKGLTKGEQRLRTNALITFRTLRNDNY